MKKRLFVGIDLPDSHKKEFSKVQSILSIPKTRWVTKENLHITIHFLGYIEEHQASPLVERLSDIALKFQSFELFYNGLIIAPPKKPPRLLWITFLENKDFVRLSESIIGEKTKKNQILPHITLARFPYFRKGEKISFPKVPFKMLSISRFHLFQSKLSPKGPSYTILETFSLA